MLRWGIRILVALALVAGAAWLFRDEIMLELVEIAADRRLPVGPHREIRWDGGPDPAGRARDE